MAGLRRPRAAAGQGRLWRRVVKGRDADGGGCGGVAHRGRKGCGQVRHTVEARVRGCEVWCTCAPRRRAAHGARLGQPGPSRGRSRVGSGDMQTPVTPQACYGRPATCGLVPGVRETVERALVAIQIQLAEIAVILVKGAFNKHGMPCAPAGGHLRRRFVAASRSSCTQSCCPDRWSCQKLLFSDCICVRPSPRAGQETPTRKFRYGPMCAFNVRVCCGEY